MKLKFKLQSDEKELSPVSFFFLILSDIFIIWLLFAGLSAQIKQFPNEYNYFPSKYRGMLIEKSWVENNAIDKICDDVLDRSRYANYHNVKGMHPDCLKIEELLVEISNDSELHTRFEKYDREKENYKALSKQDKKLKEGTALYLEIETDKTLLKECPKVQEVVGTIFEYQTREYTDSIRRFKRIFALKRVFIDLTFLIPLIALLIVWNRVSFKKNWNICLTVSSHYILLPFLPVLFELFRLIVEILPEDLFKELYDYLVSLKLVSIWYYIAIVFSVLFIIFIIWLFQTKLFTKEKNFIRRYTTGKCMNCNSKINYSADFCPVCGYSLKVECPDCKKSTVRNIPYCMNCGRKN